MFPWHRQRRLLARLRAEWAAPRDRVRHMVAIASYHASASASASAPASAMRGSDQEAKASLDDRTWDDLHLDDVFAHLDRTESTIGQQALYHRLRTSPVADHLDDFDTLVTRMHDDASTREQAQMALAHLQDPAGYDLWLLTEPDALTTRPWHAVFPIMAAFMLAALAAAPFWPVAWLLLVPGGVINLVVRIATARRVSAVIGSFRQVGPLIACARTLASLRLSDEGAAAADAGAAASGNLVVRPILEETPRLERVRRIAWWVGRDPTALGELVGGIFEYLNLVFLLDANALYFGARELRARGTALRRVIAAVGDVDAAIAVASFRAGASRWSRPRLTTDVQASTAAPSSGTTMVLTDVRHPLVREAVPNSIALGPPHGILVTGSNMAGKSTFIRTVGVNAVLAQTIHTCLASDYAAPILRVRSWIGRWDDLAAGKSYYAVEVESVLALVRASADEAPHLFLFDELFRGTNAVERIAGAEAVLTELLAGRAATHLVIAATHDAELVDLLREIYTPLHFSDAVGPDGLVFDYRLHPGPATTRNAIALLKLHGAPPTLVARALARAAALDRDRTPVGSGPRIPI